MTDAELLGVEGGGLFLSAGGGVVASAKAEAEAGRLRLEKMWAAGDIRGLAKALFTADAALMLPETNVSYGSAGATKVLTGGLWGKLSLSQLPQSGNANRIIH
jgi:hypothetical protein